MKLPPLTIGPFTAPVPIIQGGMSIRVSTSALAIPVAAIGAIGTIGGSGIPPREIADEIRTAKKATDGIIAVNIMFAMKNFFNNVKAAIDAGVDMIITGAGFSRDIFKIGRESGTPIVSIVSSPAFAKLAEKLGAAAVIVEAKEAGGHLGTDIALRDLFPSIRNVVKKIPLIAAGGLTSGTDIAEMMDKYGADGVQLATRFVLTEECPVADAFKQAYLTRGKEGTIMVKSPVGMTGRAIRTDFAEKMMRGEDVRPEKCRYHCIKGCSELYCINERLMLARDGDIDSGLVFSGENVYKLNDILPVRTVIDNLVSEAESVYKEPDAPYRREHS